MRLATLINQKRDGKLVRVSDDGASYVDVSRIANTMQEALERWTEVAPELKRLSAEESVLNAGMVRAPLPRAWQWLDGSAFASHGELMCKVLGINPAKSDRPLMYQGMSDRFLSPYEDVPLPSEELGIDFEGEFGVIVDAVPMGTTALDAHEHIKLVVQINDWSLRALAKVEMDTGFGWVQAKPACSMAPFAITPDELGDQWRNGRVCLDLEVQWNSRRFGNANGEAMEFGFHELIAHAARTRDLVAGTVIGSGTVSNANFREVGSSCIAERRGIEVVDEGKARTSFMKFGDRVRMEAHARNGAAPFGRIDQQVVKS